MIARIYNFSSVLGLLAVGRRGLPVLLAAAVVASGCATSDPSVVLPAGANAKRNRSVIIDASSCYLTAKGIDNPVACPDGINPTGGLIGTGMRGINGAPTPVFLEDFAADFEKNFMLINATTMRLPVGYGCNYSLSGMWKPQKGSNDPTDIKNYDFSAFEPLITAVRNANGTIVWTAAYDLGTEGTCTYENGEQKGKPISNPDLWAKVVRNVVKHYDRDLPNANSATVACNSNENRPWQCLASIYNVEFLRDPFGAGGYTPATKEAWITAYAAFAKEMREEFPVPGNDLSLIAPSVVLNGDPTSLNASLPGASPIYYFIDQVVAKKLPLTNLSIEVEAATPLQARTIVQAVSAYAAAKGLHYEAGYSLPAGQKSSKPMLDAKGNVVGYYAEGTEPIPIFVTDLRFTGKLPPSIANDSARKSAYLGAFYAGCKILWQGLVSRSTVGRGPRFPTIPLGPDNKVTALNSALDSDFMWFFETGLPNTVLKPSGWYQFWFNETFMAGAQQIEVFEGPDAYGLNGAPDSRRDSGILVMATRETCVDVLGKATNCVPDAANSSYPAVDKFRQHKLHVMVVDLDVAADDPVSKLGILEHNLRIEMRGLPKETKTVGYKWAYMDGTDATWCKADASLKDTPYSCGYEFPEQGLLDISEGTFHFTRNVGVPSMHYFQFLY